MRAHRDRPCWNAFAKGLRDGSSVRATCHDSLESVFVYRCIFDTIAAKPHAGLSAFADELVSNGIQKRAGVDEALLPDVKFDL